MAYQPVNVPLAPCDNEIPTPLTLEQAIQIISGVVPHMPMESQISFFAMVFGTTSSLPSREVPVIPTRPPQPPRPPRLPLTSDVLRGVVQARAVQQLRESDSAFEAKQRAAEETLKMSRKSRGVTKCYEKPHKNEMVEKRASRAIIFAENMHTTPYGVPWSSRGALMPLNLHVAETSSNSAAYFHQWDSRDPSPTVRMYPPV